MKKFARKERDRFIWVLAWKLAFTTRQIQSVLAAEGTELSTKQIKRIISKTEKEIYGK
jgi:hypothetical protein